MLQKWGWLGLSHVCFQSQTLLLTRRAGCHLFIFAPNRTRVVRVCMCFCLLRSLSTPADQKGIRQLPCPNNAFNLGHVCLAIVWPPHPPHVGSDDNKVWTRPSPNGFSAPRSRRSGRLPPRDRQAAPSRLSLRARPAGRKPQGRARKHWWDLISLRAQWGHLGTPHVTPPRRSPSLCRAAPPALLQILT